MAFELERNGGGGYEKKLYAEFNVKLNLAENSKTPFVINTAHVEQEVEQKDKRGNPIIVDVWTPCNLAVLKEEAIKSGKNLTNKVDYKYMDIEQAFKSIRGTLKWIKIDDGDKYRNLRLILVDDAAKEQYNIRIPFGMRTRSTIINQLANLSFATNPTFTITSIEEKNRKGGKEYRFLLLINDVSVPHRFYNPHSFEERQKDVSLSKELVDVNGEMLPEILDANDNSEICQYLIELFNQNENLRAMPPTKPPFNEGVEYGWYVKNSTNHYDHESQFSSSFVFPIVWEDTEEIGQNGKKVRKPYLNGKNVLEWVQKGETPKTSSTPAKAKPTNPISMDNEDLPF